MQNTNSLRLTVYNFDIFNKSSCPCVLTQKYHFQKHEKWGLGKYSVITFLIQITFTLKHYYVFYKALKSWGKGYKKTDLPTLGKVCDFEFRGWSLQISTISLNMHWSLKINHFWKEKNFHFDKHALYFRIYWIYFLKYRKYRCKVNFGRQYSTTTCRLVGLP